MLVTLRETDRTFWLRVAAGTTALDLAQYFERPVIVDMLHEHGAKAN